MFSLLQVFVYLGKMLLVYHPERLCKSSCKTFNNDEKVVYPSLKQVKPAEKNYDEVYSNSQKAKNLQAIAEWIMDKKKSEDINSQWCFIVAVLDRMFFIGSLTPALMAVSRLVIAVSGNVGWRYTG